MLKAVFAALVSASFVCATISVAEAAPRHKQVSKKYKRSGKSSSSYGSYYQTQRSYYTCGYSRC